MTRTSHRIIFFMLVVFFAVSFLASFPVSAISSGEVSLNYSLRVDKMSQNGNVIYIYMEKNVKTTKFRFAERLVSTTGITAGAAGNLFVSSAYDKFSVTLRVGGASTEYTVYVLPYGAAYKPSVSYTTRVASYNVSDDTITVTRTAGAITGKIMFSNDFTSTDGYNKSGIFTISQGSGYNITFDIFGRSKTYFVCDSEYNQDDVKLVPKTTYMLRTSEVVFSLLKGDDSIKVLLTEGARSARVKFSSQYVSTTGVVSDGLFYIIPDKSFEIVFLQNNRFVTWTVTAGYATKEKNGFINENGKTYYYDNNVMSTGLCTIGSNKYYFDASGVMQTGNVLVDGIYMTFGDNGIFVSNMTGYSVRNGKYYYYSNGVPLSGWNVINDEKLFFLSDGMLVGSEDDRTEISVFEANVSTYDDGGNIISNTLNSAWDDYIISNTNTSVYEQSGGWNGTDEHYLSHHEPISYGLELVNPYQTGQAEFKYTLPSDKSFYEAELILNERKCYSSVSTISISPTGKEGSYTNIYTATDDTSGFDQHFDITEFIISDTIYIKVEMPSVSSGCPDWPAVYRIIINAQTAARQANGFVSENGKKFYYVNGEKATGWKTIDSTLYYFNSDGSMATGVTKIGSDTHCFSKSGLYYGKFSSNYYGLYYDGRSVYYYKNGTVSSGSRFWYQQNGYEYYITDSGKAATGVTVVNGQYRSFNDEGVLLYNVISGLGNKMYYFDSDGYRKTGFIAYGSNIYYFDPDMQFGWKTIGDAMYYFKADGTMAVGTTLIDSITYYFDTDGKRMIDSVTNQQFVDAAGNVYGVGTGSTSDKSAVYTNTTGTDYEYNVKNFGALGNGNTDDTSAIQRAINAAGSGRTVFFPAGTYAIGSTLFLPQGVSLVGVPSDTETGGSVIKASRSMTNMIGTASSTTKFANCTVTSLTFDGGKDRNLTVSNAIDAPAFNGVKLANINVRNITGRGLNSYQGSVSDPTWIIEIENFKYSGDDYALYLISSDTLVNHVYVDGGLGIYDYNYGGNCYNDLYVTNVNGAGLTVGRPLMNEDGHVAVTDSTFRNNTFGIMLDSASAFNKQVAIEGCEFISNKTADVSLNNVNGVSFVNCNFRDQTPFRNNSVTNGVTVSACNFAATSYVVRRFAEYDNTFSVTQFSEKGCVLENEDYDYRAVYNAIALRSKSGKVTATSPSDGSSGIQNAIDSLGSRGGVVLLRKGSYRFTATVTLPSNVILVGESSNSNTTAKPNADFTTMFRFADGSCNSGIVNISTTSSSYSITNYIYGKDVSNCFVDKLDSDSNTVSKITNMILFENSEHCTVNTIVAGVGDGIGIIVNLKNSRYCLVQTSYISRGVCGTYVNGGYGHEIKNNHYDWFSESAVKFIGNGYYYTSIYGTYCDINRRVVTVTSNTPVCAYVYIASVTFREDGIPARYDSGATEYRTTPEIYLTNVKKVWIYGCHSETMYYTLNYNMIEGAGELSFITVVGNYCDDLYDTDTSMCMGEGCTVYENKIY